MEWTDKYSGQKYHVTTTGKSSPTTARVRSFRDVLAAYATHPESKSCDANGDPCGRSTVGLLQTRPVGVRVIHEIGKEANRLEELAAGHIKRLTDVLEQYDDRRELWQQVRPYLRGMPPARIACAAGVTQRAIRAMINGQAIPNQLHLEALATLIGRQSNES